MRIPAIVLVLFTASPLVAQEKTAPEPRKMLYQFLLDEAQKHFDARRLEVAKLKTPAEIQARQARLKAKFVEALGGFPDKTPLNPKVVGTVQGDGFRVEKVIYESRPDHHVTANFYVPAGKGPFPGVLLPCGHSANGKAAEAYQRAASLMAMNGLAVLCYDPIGQGERLQLLTENNKPGVPGSTSEHTMVGIGALLVGQSTATYRIWDGIRSLDYLASRPEVDPKKLGCTGNSGGGTLTAYLMALDDRIVAAAPSCYITTLERLFATLGPQDAEQNIPGQVAFGMDHADYVTMRAPRPTLICTATQDFFDIGGSWATFREASLVYGKLGHGERVAMFEYDDKHGFSKPRREAAMRWMRRWLLGIDDSPSETNFKSFPDAELQCTRSGQVLADFKGRSAFHLNAAAAKELAPLRAKFPDRAEPERLAEIRRLLGMGTVSPKSSGGRINGGARQLTIGFSPEPGITLSGLLINPLVEARSLIVYLSERGIAEDNRSGGPLERLAANNRQVLALDVRGLGETAPAPPSGKRSYFGSTFKHAFLSMHLNRPLLGQRVLDVLSALPQTKEMEIELIGAGEAGPVALHVAALEPRVKSVTLENSLVSWANVVNTPVSYEQLANVVPGVLKVYDLPELAASLAPRQLTIRNPVDAALRPVSQADLDAAYAACRDRYTKVSAEDKLKLQAGR